MQELAAVRLYELKHKDAPFHDGSFESWRKEASLTHPFHYEDGVTIWVSKEDLTPDDDFLGQSVAGADEPDADED